MDLCSNPRPPDFPVLRMYGHARANHDYPVLMIKRAQGEWTEGFDSANYEIFYEPDADMMNAIRDGTMYKWETAGLSLLSDTACVVGCRYMFTEILSCQQPWTGDQRAKYEILHSYE
jgi:hypothetical protein